MIEVSASYICILWDGRDKMPFAVMDCAEVKELKTPVATAFGEIATGVGQVLMACQKKVGQIGLTPAQLSQAEHAEHLRAERSKQLAASAGEPAPDNVVPFRAADDTKGAA
ncbi:MAG: hypothetical protein ABSH16_00080 [Sedimentisphaerales bacterium]